MHSIFYVYSNCGHCIRHVKLMFYIYWGMQSIVAVYFIHHYIKYKNLVNDVTN